MKKLDVQISKITEVKNPIYYGDDLLHLYIHTEQASYIQFFCLDLFYYTDNINELLACILKQEMIYAELSGDFPLGDSRQPIYKSLRPF
ncbi:hypothetical protein KTJ63_18250, partial [Acinetobacter baumannii]|nr:hypothetical protein [Acinetobacter baumannii]